MNRLRKLAWRVQQVVAKPTPRLFFVRGHPRSGTNWVGALLNLHPRINCHGEFHFEEIRRAVDSLQSQHWQITGREPLRSVLDHAFHQFVRTCVLSLDARKPGASWIGDRTPRALRPLVPGAPHFLIVRDGRDVLVSWTYHVLRQKPDVLGAVVPRPLLEGFESAVRRFQQDPACFRNHPELLLADEGWVRHVARRWAEWTRADHQAAALIDAGELDATVQTIRYERLHADTDAGRRAMYEFLGLDPAEAAPLSPESRTSPGFSRDDATSFFRHGQVGDWKAYATDCMRAWFKEEAGQALIDLGYEKDVNW